MFQIVGMIFVIVFAILLAYTTVETSRLYEGDKKNAN